MGERSKTIPWPCASMMGLCGRLDSSDDDLFEAFRRANSKSIHYERNAKKQLPGPFVVIKSFPAVGHFRNRILAMLRRTDLSTAPKCALAHCRSTPKGVRAHRGTNVAAGAE